MQYKIHATLIAIVLFSGACKATARTGAAPDSASHVESAQLDIVGKPIVGMPLAADAHNLAGSLSSANYKWFRLGADGSRIKVGDSSAQYTLAAPDAGARIMVSWDNKDANIVQHSKATEPVRWPRQSGTVHIESNGKALVPATPLSAVTKNLSGDGSISYLWYSGNIQTGFLPISGAVYQNYVLTTEDVGKFIKVEVSQPRADGKINAHTNSQVRELNIRGNVDITGIPEISRTLTAVTSFEEREITSYTWYADGTIIPGAAAQSYQLTARQQGLTIKASVTRTGYGIIESPQTAPVSYAVLGGMVNIAPATGIRPGTTITAHTGNIIGKNGNAVYEWCAENGSLNGAPLNDSSYTVINADVGKKIKVRVSYEKSHGRLESAVTGMVSHTDMLGTITIRDDTKTDRCFRAVLSPDYNGTGAFTIFTWYRNGIPILSGQGHTFSAYHLTKDDMGKTIKVVIIAPNHLSGSISAEKIAPAWKSFA